MVTKYRNEVVLAKVVGQAKFPHFDQMQRESERIFLEMHKYVEQVFLRFLMAALTLFQSGFDDRFARMAGNECCVDH